MSTTAAAPHRGHEYREALAGLRAAQKPGQGVPAYTRWVNRPLARYAAAAAATVGLTANGVTAASALFSAGGLLLLLAGPPTPVTGAATALLLATGYVLDSADGQVARLTRTGSPAGEWLDHVVDSVRTPAVHLSVLSAFLLRPEAVGVPGLFGVVLPLLFCLVAVGQFMSQILAEQLRRGRPAAAEAPVGPVRSFLNLPMDAGVTCWIFVLWGWPTVFFSAYGALLVVTVVITAASMRRKYLGLRPQPSVPTTDRSSCHDH
ncbi:CDP-alcohol phosphatidyltransferase family protein [Kocuria sp. CPCC 205258]|uniref:CDP-alcohol phosphatidyltransferase family protein n=1 Tax=Kocuria sp. CPCC 205258 TaxID=3073552 RepID=UPI0034D6FEEE